MDALRDFSGFRSQSGPDIHSSAEMSGMSKTGHSSQFSGFNAAENAGFTPIGRGRRTPPKAVVY